ncbi:diguanylate cyclase domain-containing protein [Shewanella baltica]|uniref:diguanylate cyclase domain-containing protein n=1 Tax=Shewanella baltica TaxID=62322 RepID=UPI00217E900A|nr:diguanylate cyclase [Shewanella baltica]MCS6193319.1 diguanylate cyclase [Shewanella baltica]
MASDTAAEHIKQLQAEIAQLKRENAQLTALNRRAEEKLFAALDGNGLCLWEQHIPSGNLTIFNMRWGEMLGFSPEELAAHVDIWKSKLHPEDKAWVIKAFDDHVSGKSDYYQAVHRMLHKDGSVTWVSDRGRIVERLADGTPLRMMGSHIDITQEKRYELDLAQLAHSDPLTNLMNRQAIAMAFDECLQPEMRGALFFIDLDGFKALNDRHGHKFGDSLLMHVAHTLVCHAGELAQIARLGGDEFVILLPLSETESLAMLAQSLLDVYRQGFLLEGCDVEIGLSIGIDIFSYGDSFAKSCDRADAAMYRVKHQGKNGYRFYLPSK